MKCGKARRSVMSHTDVETPDGKYIGTVKVGEKGQIVIPKQVRDMFDTSRKSAKPIIEYMDSIKVTKKTGAESERVAY